MNANRNATIRILKLVESLSIGVSSLRVKYNLISTGHRSSIIRKVVEYQLKEDIKLNWTL